MCRIRRTGVSRRNLFRGRKGIPAQDTGFEACIRRVGPVQPQDVIEEAAGRLHDEDRPTAGGTGGSCRTIVHEGRRWSFVLHGLAWLPGHRHGTDSLEALAARLAHSPVPEAVGELRGVFALFLFDRTRREGWWTVDPSGLFQLFVAPGYVGPDLLAAARSLPASRRAVDPQRFLQILAYDAPFDGGTLFSGVRVLGADEVLHLGPDGRRTPLPKPAPVPQEADVEAQLRAEMTHLATALSGERVEADLTGGMDSRVLVLLARAAGLAFTTALSGPADGPEARVAAAVARRLHLPFRAVPHDISRFPADLDEILLETGGLASPLRFHIDWSLLRDRRARGVSVVLRGFGGEFLRDHWLVQDLPFLAGGPPHPGRLWRLRILRRPIVPELLPGSLAADARRRLFDHFRAAAAGIGGESRAERVARICFACRVRRPWGGTLTGFVRSGLPVAVPLLDRRVLELAFRTPPHRLLFHLPHRRLATGTDPEIAALPTVHGFTCSAELRHLLPDLLRRLRFEADRAFGRFVRRRGGRPILWHGAEMLAVHPDYDRLVRQSGVVEESVRTLVRAGLLAPRADAERLPPSWRAPVVHVAKILGHLA